MGILGAIPGIGMGSELIWHAVVKIIMGVIAIIIGLLGKKKTWAQSMLFSLNPVIGKQRPGFFIAMHRLYVAMFAPQGYLRSQDHKLSMQV